MSRRTWLTSHVMSAGFAFAIGTCWYKSTFPAVNATIGTILIGVAWAMGLWRLGPNHKTGAPGA